MEKKFQYFSAFGLSTLKDITVFLEKFGCCEELREDIFEYIRVSKPHKIGLPKQEQKTFSRECRYCGAPTMGHEMPRCEHRRTGRIYYEECTGCCHYMEKFDIDGVISFHHWNPQLETWETEGGK